MERSGHRSRIRYLSSNCDECVQTLYAICGLERVLHDKVQQRRRQALTGLQVAHLIAVACSPAPDGHLARYDPPVAQKNELKPWQHEHWCLPSVGGEFVAAMEDVLDHNAGRVRPALSDGLSG